MLLRFVQDLKQEKEVFDVQAILRTIEDLIDHTGGNRMTSDAQSLRRVQASNIAASRARRAGLAAQKHRETNKLPMRGNLSPTDWFSKVREGLYELYKASIDHEVGWRAAHSEVTRMSEKLNIDEAKAFYRYLDEGLFKQLKDDGFSLVDLGNGVKDFQHPYAVSRALYDLAQGRIDGETKVKKTRFDEDTSQFKQQATTRAQNLNGIQPGRDVEIAGIFDKLEYRHRVEAVYDMRFGAVTKDGMTPTLDEMINKFLSSSIS